jgi:hypothetical protein
MTTTNSLLKSFRSGIRFSERLFKNLPIQLKWWYRQIKNNCDSIHLWRVRNTYHISIDYILGVIIILFYIFVILPFILLWALLKSI